jgi:hypothetical protein
LVQEIIAAYERDENRSSARDLLEKADGNKPQTSD